MTFPVLSANGPSGYNLTRSLRFRSSASAYLNRTPATTTNQTTWTWSAWVKRGALATGEFITASDSTGGTNFDSIDVNADTFRVYFNGTTSAFLVTTAVYRDPSSWYHLIVAVDTTQATSSNRIKMYVNGVQVTSFSTATYPAQNYSTFFNLNGRKNVIGANALTSPSQFFDGYFAEVNFIDGQALTPSSFGSTNSTTGVWQPAKYTGTYGTNGFYLPFTDNSALTTSSNAGLGKDFSGNANYWVTNNISLTAGATYDSMTDVPTLTSATAANYPTFNPLNSVTQGVLTNGNLTISSPTVTWLTGIGTIQLPTSGKYYFECTISSGGVGQGIEIGLVDYSENTYRTYKNTGSKNSNTGGPVSYGTSFGASAVIGVAIDAGGGTIAFYNNNTAQGTAFTDIASAVPSSGWFLAFQVNDTSNNSINFGQRPFSYTPPSGFVALNTYNLPASTVPNGAAYMAATLATGNNSTQVITNTVGSASFQPDFVWMKIRSTSENHIAYDSVRGVQNYLVPNLTLAEGTSSQGLISFNSNGFTLGNINPNYAGSPTFVAWQWKGGGTAVSNTSGSITSSVSANTTSGFSVTTYTGGGAAATVGHGLGVAPSMVIVKKRSAAGDQWYTYHSSNKLPNSNAADNRVFINLTNASNADAAAWNNTNPTSSVFSIGSSTEVSANGATFVAYCFAAIKGFSAFGSYTGNGSTDGPFVYLGFRPRFVMVKRTDSTGDWQILDSSRSTYNAADARLIADSNIAEINNTGGNTDFLSNGFKFKNVNGDDNASGGTFIYMAFAENPLNYSLAR